MSKFKRIEDDRTVEAAVDWGDLASGIGKGIGKVWNNLSGRGIPDGVQEGITKRFQNIPGELENYGKEGLNLHMMQKLLDNDGGAALRNMLKNGKAKFNTAGELILDPSEYQRAMSSILDGNIKAPSSLFAKFTQPLNWVASSIIKFDPADQNKIMDKTVDGIETSYGRPVKLRDLISRNIQDANGVGGDLKLLGIPGQDQGVAFNISLGNIMKDVAEFQQKRTMLNNGITGANIAVGTAAAGALGYGAYKAKQLADGVQQNYNISPNNGPMYDPATSGRYLPPGMTPQNGQQQSPNQTAPAPNQTAPVVPTPTPRSYAPLNYIPIDTNAMFLKSDSGNKFRRVMAQDISENDTQQEQQKQQEQQEHTTGATEIMQVLQKTDMPDLNTLYTNISKIAQGGGEQALLTIARYISPYVDQLEPIAPYIKKN